MRAYRAGQAVEDHCRQCHEDRMHTVIVVDGAGPAHPGTLRLLRQRAQLPRGTAEYGSRQPAAGRRNTDTATGVRSPVSGARSASGADRPASPRSEPTRSEAVAPRQRARKALSTHESRHHDQRSREPAPPRHPRGDRPDARGPGGEVARRRARAAPRQARPAGEELADRDVLPQGRDAAQPPAHARTAGERVGPAGRPEGEDPELHHRLLRIAHQLQRALRRRRRSDSPARHRT